MPGEDILRISPKRRSYSKYFTEGYSEYFILTRYRADIADNTRDSPQHSTFYHSLETTPTVSTLHYCVHGGKHKVPQIITVVKVLIKAQIVKSLTDS